MGKRKNTHEFSDQYGESGPQDREDFGGGGGAGRGGGGGRGGGSAGRSRAGGVSLTFSRQLPKFLQAYAHMLPAGGPGGGDEDDPAIVDAARDSARAAAEREDEAEDDAAAEEARDGTGRAFMLWRACGVKGVEPRGVGVLSLLHDSCSPDLTLPCCLPLSVMLLQEAIRRALEEDPTLAAQLGGEALARVRAGGEKEAGNRAFAAKDYDTAATHFTAAIELDPQCVSLPLSFLLHPQCVAPLFAEAVMGRASWPALVTNRAHTPHTAIHPQECGVLQQSLCRACKPRPL